MKEETVSDAALRQFLLGDVDDEERQRIESSFLTDAHARDRILTAEQDLVEDYLEDSLTAADKEKFLSLYAGTSEQRRKLRITKSIKDWAAGEGRVTAVGASATSFWDRLTGRFGLKPMFVIPIAATAVIAIVVALVWLNGRTDERNTQAALNQEFARLNDPESLRQTPPGLVSVTLRPGALRGVEGQQEVLKSAGTPMVELRLVWAQKDRYPAYRGIVSRVSSNEAGTTPLLHAENDGNTVRLRIPAHFLTRGVYRVELSGVAVDGSTSATEEYQFTVGN
jgi:anti-sigma factor RsiW